MRNMRHLVRQLEHSLWEDEERDNHNKHVKEADLAISFLELEMERLKASFRKLKGFQGKFMADRNSPFAKEVVDTFEQLSDITQQLSQFYRKGIIEIEKAQSLFTMMDDD